MKSAVKVAFILATALSGAALPASGQLWKGKPGDVAALEKASRQENPAAMAEFAWHLIEGEGGRKFDADEIHALFEKSAAKGDPLGKVGLSRCLAKGIGTAADMKRAWELAEEAGRSKHPEAWKQTGFLLYRGFGAPADRKKAIEWTRRAAEAGSISAQSNLLVYTNYDGHPDRYSPQAEIALRHGHMNAIANAMFGYHFDRGSPEEHAKYEKMIRILEDRAARNHPDALVCLASVRENQGDSDAKAMLLLRAARTGTADGVSDICEQLSFAENPALGRTSSPYYIRDSDRGNLSWFAYQQGSRSDATVMRASSIAAKGGAGLKADLPAAIRILKENLPGKNKLLHHQLALLHLSAARGKNGPPESGKLALAHAIYSSDRQPRSIGLISYLLSGKVSGIPADLPRAQAAVSRTPDSDPAKTANAKRLEGKLDDSQLAVSKRLAEEGFPTAASDLEEARKILSEAGELREAQD